MGELSSFGVCTSEFRSWKPVITVGFLNVYGGERGFEMGSGARSSILFSSTGGVAF